MTTGMFVECLSDGVNEVGSFGWACPNPDVALPVPLSLTGGPVLRPAQAQPQHPCRGGAPGDQGLILHHPTAPCCGAVAGRVCCGPTGLGGLK